MAKWFRWLCLLAAISPLTLAAQQAATLTGRVTDDAGTPLAGVSVGIPSLNVGTTTRADGGYTLTVPASRVGAGQTVQVTASALNRRSVSQTVRLTPGGSATLNFQMAADVLQLEGIVATGLGTATTRERLGVSISSVKAEELTRVQNSNVVSAIAGKAPGVEITSSSGEPGASAYIRIRGTKTIQGNGQPLFVVDGVPVSNAENFIPASVQYGEDSDLAGNITPNRVADLNPADIASMEILKGAAASAIYGARAANGVVLITTKSAQAGRTRATLRTTFSSDEVNKGIPLQRSFGQGTRGNSVKGAFNQFGGAVLRSWGAPVSGETFDHWGELFENGNLMDTDFSLSGGSERTTYYLSLGRVDHNGVIVGSNDRYEKTTARLKGSHEIASGLRVTGNVAYADVDGSFIQKGSNLSGLLLGGLRTPPDFNNQPYLTENGLQRSYSNPNPSGPLDQGIFDNPFFTINENRATSTVGRTFGNIAVDYDPAAWVKLNYTLGLDYSNDNQLNYLPIGNYTYAPGYLGNAQFLNKQITHDVTSTLSHSLQEGIDATLTLGYGRNARRFDRFFVEGQDFIAPGVFTLNNTITRTPNEFHSRIHTESFFGQAQVELFDQIFLTGALRNDGFSTFGESKKRHWFPKASIAWDFTETLGIETGPLSFGKVRAAWGQAGNEPPVYGTLFGFSAADIGTGWNDFLRTTLGGRGGLYTSLTKPQQDLGPERTTETEFGIDLAFLDQRVSFGATYYDSQTEDAILQTPLAPSTGFFFQLQNAASIENKGVELTLDLRPVEMQNFTWNLGANWSTNENEVTSLGDPDRKYISMGGFVGTAAVVGHPIGVMRANGFYRCGMLGESAPANITSACSGAPKGAMFINANGFPVLDPEARVIGDPNPDWTAGIRNGFTLFNRVEISTLVDIKQGGDVWNGTRGALYSYGTHKDTEKRATCTAPRGNQATGCTGNELVFGTSILPGPVVGPGAGKAVPIGQNWYQNGLGSGFNGASEQFIEDGSYVKLREIAISFGLPADFSRRLGMSDIDVRLAGRNLKTWTDYTGIDPETNLTGTSPIRGQDYFNNPQTRQWSLSVGLTR